MLGYWFFPRRLIIVLCIDHPTVLHAASSFSQWSHLGEVQSYQTYIEPHAELMLLNLLLYFFNNHSYIYYSRSFILPANCTYALVVARFDTQTSLLCICFYVCTCTRSYIHTYRDWIFRSLSKFDFFTDYFRPQICFIFFQQIFLAINFHIAF